MNSVKILVLLVAISAISFSAGKFLAPSKVEVREVEKVVYRETTDTKRDVNRTETIKPDGTRVITTTSSTERKTDSDLTKDTEKTKITDARPGWHINVRYEPALVGFQSYAYGIDIQRRLFSEVYLGATYSSQKTIGISLGVGF